MRNAEPVRESRHVHGPYGFAGHVPWLAPSHVAAQHGDVVGVLAQHIADEGLADGDARVAMSAVEEERDGPASEAGIACGASDDPRPR